MPWPADRASEEHLPLAGIKVLDCSRVLAGPFASQILGDLGADVIKVEQRDAGDPVRQLGPPFVGDSAAYFLATNRNRRSMVADFTSDADRSVIAELAGEADVLIENFLPHQAAAFGFDELRAGLPDLVWISVRPARTGGPLASQPAFDLLAQARSGIMAVTGNVGGSPTKVGAPIADVLAGLYAAVAALAGLQAKQKGGAGLHAEVPLLESAITGLVNQAQNVLVTGSEPQRLGNDHPSIAPYGPVACSDGPLLLAVGTERQYRALLEVLDDATLRNDPRFSTNGDRVDHRDVLAQVLDGIFTSATREEWMELLGRAGIPSAPINTVGEALADPQVRDHGLILDATYDGHPVRIVGSPITINGAVLPLRRMPPSLGADDAAIRRGIEA